MRSIVSFSASAFVLVVASAHSALAAPTEINVFTQASSTASLQIGAASTSNTVVQQNLATGSSSSSITNYLADLPAAPDVAQAESDAYVQLTSPNSGVLALISGAQLYLSTPGAVGAAHTSGNTGEPLNDASYAFTDSHPFRVTFTYVDSQQGSQLGYFGPYIAEQGGVPIGPGLPTNGSGSFSELFPAGLLQIEFYDDIYSADALLAAAPAELTSSTDYRLSFTITDVPEPATWMLMLIGIAGLGGAIRSTRKASFCPAALTFS